MKGKQKYLIIALVVVVVLALGYIAVDKYRDSQNQKLVEAANYGYRQAQVDVVNTILSDLQANGYTQITLPGENNQTQAIILVPYQPPQEEEAETTE